MNFIMHATQEQLNKIRRLPNYRFVVYESAFENPSFIDAQDFLRQSFALLYQAEGFEDDTFLVLKITLCDKAITLRVSCDYYTVTCSAKKGASRTLATWQGNAQFSGYSMDDLEYSLVNLFLTKTGPIAASPKIQELLRSPLSSLVCNVTVQLLAKDENRGEPASEIYQRVCDIIDSYSGQTPFSDHVKECISSGTPKGCGTLALFSESNAGHLS